MARELGPVVVFVGDVEVARDFAVDGLGFEEVVRDEVSVALVIEGAMVLFVRTDGGDDLLARSTATADPARPTYVLNVFVDDVDAALEQAMAAGARLVAPVQDRPWGRRTAHVEGPDGVMWELSRAID